MTQIIRSGAFLQQCWAVHPLCLQVKRMANDRTLMLACTSCKSAHHVTLGLVATKEAARRPGDGGPIQEGETLLNACVVQHHSALSLRNMNVFEDLVLLRCAECRRHYEVTVASFETHQR